jgi:16S rRNA (uracil1498-N3)-methyltransferase
MFLYIKNINEQIIFSPENKHFFSLRPRILEHFWVTDLNGNLAKIEITEINKKQKQIKFKILTKKSFEKPKNPKKILLQSIPEKLYLEKLMEILAFSGIQKIILFYTQFSLKQKISLERLDKILIRSCEQSQIIFKPEIIFLPKADLKDLLKENQPKVLDTEKKSELTQNDNQKNSLDTKEVIMVGPEGGFSEKEKKLFRDYNLEIINLEKIIYPSWIAGFVYFQRKM